MSRREFPSDRFNDESLAKAFAAVSALPDFDIVRWGILRRYAEVRRIFTFTDPNCVNRALGKAEELEWVLDQLGQPLYDGLPLADGTSDGEIAGAAREPAPEIGGGYPDGFGSLPPL